MKNFIFISPNFPTNYWMFCRELKNNGINVLGIGDQPYDDLNKNLKERHIRGGMSTRDKYLNPEMFINGSINWTDKNNSIVYSKQIINIKCHEDYDYQ